MIASIFGFALAAQFVSLPGLETPYYIVLLGAGALKLASLPVAELSPLPERSYETIGKPVLSAPGV